MTIQFNTEKAKGLFIAVPEHTIEWEISKKTHLGYLWICFPKNRKLDNYPIPIGNYLIIGDVKKTGNLVISTIVESRRWTPFDLTENQIEKPIGGLLYRDYSKNDEWVCDAVESFNSLFIHAFSNENSGDSNPQEKTEKWILLICKND